MVDECNVKFLQRMVLDRAHPDKVEAFITLLRRKASAGELRCKRKFSLAEVNEAVERFVKVKAGPELGSTGAAGSCTDAKPSIATIERSGSRSRSRSPCCRTRIC